MRIPCWHRTTSLPTRSKVMNLILMTNNKETESQWNILFSARPPDKAAKYSGNGGGWARDRGIPFIVARLSMDGRVKWIRVVAMGTIQIPFSDKRTQQGWGLDGWRAWRAALVVGGDMPKSGIIGECTFAYIFTLQDRTFFANCLQIITKWICAYPRMQEVN